MVHASFARREGWPWKSQKCFPAEKDERKSDNKYKSESAPQQANGSR